MAWSRFASHPKKPTIEKSLQMILNVIKDAMVHGYIELTHVHLYPEVAPILAEALVQMPLFVLTMQDTVFREPVVAMMSHVLTCSETLECLDLSGCRFSATGTVNSFRQISDMMKRSKLRRLYLHASTLLVLAIYKGLINHPSLEHLHLYVANKEVYEEGAVERLLTAEGCRLKGLEVHSFYAVMNAVIKALPTNRSLKTLDLKGHSLEQIKNLTGALQVNVGIEEVILKGSSEEEVIAFASELPTLQRLRKLDLGGQGCTPEAVESLRNALEKGVCNLQSLKFQNERNFMMPGPSIPDFFYDCSDECLQAIAYQLTLNRNVKPFKGSKQNREPASIWPVVIGRVQAPAIPKHDHIYDYNWILPNLKVCLPGPRLPFVCERAKNDFDFLMEITKEIFDNPRLESVRPNMGREGPKYSPLEQLRGGPANDDLFRHSFSNDITFALLKSGVVPLTEKQDEATPGVDLSGTNKK